MKTELGEMRVIDAHAHFFSHKFYQGFAALLKEQLPADDPYGGLAKRLKFELPDPDPASLARRWVEEMDRHGLSRMVLMTSAVGDEDSVAAAVRARPERIIGYFMHDPTKPDAPDRARKALGAGLRGICLFPAMHHFHVWEERAYHAYEEAERHGAIVFVHCGILKVGIRDLLGLPSKFDMRFSNPVDVVRIAKEFPKVAFQIPHFGCGYFREALMVGDQCPNVFLDTSSSNAWVKTMPRPLSLGDLFQGALRVLGPERILFGSDSSFMPRGWRRDIFDAQVQAMKGLEVSSQDARLIFGGNLVRLLNL